MGVAPGFVTQAVLSIDDDDPFDPNLLDDFETEPVSVRGGGRPRARERRGAAGRSAGLARTGPGRRPAPRRDPDPGGHRRGLLPRPRSRRGHGCRRRHDVVTVAILTRPGFDATDRGPRHRPLRGARARSTATVTAGPGATRPTWTATETATSSSTSTSTTPASTATPTARPSPAGRSRASASCTTAAPASAATSRWPRTGPWPRG